MPYLVICGWTYAVFVVETYLARFPAEMLPIPQICLWPVVLVYIAVKLDRTAALGWAAGVGLLSDAFTPGRMGVGMLCAVLAVAVLQEWPKQSRLGVTAAAGLSFSSVFGVEFTQGILERLLEAAEMEVELLASAAAWAALAASGIVLCTMLVGGGVVRVAIYSKAAVRN